MPPKGSHHTDESKRMMREHAHVMYGEDNPSKRPEVREKNRGHPWHHKPDTKAKMSAAKKGRLPPNANQFLIHASGDENVSKRPEVREKISKALKGRSAPWLQGENHFAWNGGVSFEPYCPKFTREFKERVRAFFGHICPNCGMPQNGEKLCVHHIHYNKDTCCDGSTPLFIPLCKSCHGKTNGKKNRAQFEQYFTELINTWYGGKCYLTREEMAVYGSSLPCEVPTIQGSGVLEVREDLGE